MHSQDSSPYRVLASLGGKLPDEASTGALGSVLAASLVPGTVVWLEGDLGAGKTSLVRGLLRSLDYQGPVKSPTYTLVEVYVISSIYWYHFDFYRFNDPEEFADAGLGEYFRDDAVCLVEWPDKARGFVPSPDLVLRLRFSSAEDEFGRQVDALACSERGKSCLKKIAHALPSAVI